MSYFVRHVTISFILLYRKTDSLLPWSLQMLSANLTANQNHLSSIRTLATVSMNMNIELVLLRKV
jgi:hypothetical protein